MPPYYILKVCSAEIQSVGAISGKNGFFYASISYNDVKQRTSNIESKVSPTWNESLPLKEVEEKSIVSIKLKQVSSIKDNNIGYSQLSLSENSGKVQVSLYPTKDKLSKKTGPVGFFILYLHSSDAHKNAKVALGNVIRISLGSEANDTWEEIDNMIQYGKDIVHSKLLESCESLLPLDSFIAGIEAGIDAVSEMYPLIKLGWIALSSLYKLKEKQKALDARIYDLIHELLHVLRIAGNVSSTKQLVKTSNIDLLDLITECSYFIRGYLPRGFIGHALRPGEEATVGNYAKDIRALKSRLRDSVSVHSMNLIESIADASLLTKLKITLNPSIISGADRSKCLKGTRTRIQDRISNWIYDTGLYKENVAFLLGGAGTGKSTIATTIAENCRERGRLGCYLFFQRGHSDPNTVIQTIAYNLAVSNQSVALYVDKALRRCGNLSSATHETLFNILLRDTLPPSVKDIHYPILIVLDAIDECGTPETRATLLDVLEKGLPGLPSNFRFLITGRPESDIKAFSSSLKAYESDINLDDIPDDNKKDVCTYINHELEVLKKRGKLKVRQDWPWDANVKKLGEAADGLFIWASTAIKYVSGAKMHPTRHLEQLISNTKTLDLDELYMTVIETSLDWDEDTQALFTSVFSLIFFRKSPLLDEDIEGILNLDQGDTAELLSNLRSLVRYESGQPIKIHHISFFDYLISCHGKPWHIDVDSQRRIISANCFDRMSDLLRFNICNLESSFLTNEQIPDLEERIKKNIPSVMKYVCRNWARHLSDVPYSQDMCDKLREFAFEKLLFWLEVLSLTMTFDDCVNTALTSTIAWLGDNDVELYEFLQDAHRQATIFSEPISQSAPHIYTTLLPLTKMESVFSKRYAEFASSVVQVKYVGIKKRPALIKVIEGLENQFNSISFSPDGTKIVSGSGMFESDEESRRGIICVRDAMSGKVLAGPLEGHTEPILTVAFSRDGKKIASGSTDKTIRVWDASNGELVQGPLQGHNGWVRSVAFSPDGKYIASGSDDMTNRLWDASNGLLSGTPLMGDTWCISSITFSPNSHYLASGSEDGSIILWDVNSRKRKTDPFIGSISSIISIVFSANGENIISCSFDGAIRVCNVSTGRILHQNPRSGSEMVKEAAHSFDGQHTLTVYNDGMMRMWNVLDFTEPPKWFEGGHQCLSVTVAPDGSRFASSIDDGTIKTWDVVGSVSETESFKGQRKFWAVALSQSGRYVAAGLEDHTVCVWETDSGKLEHGPWLGHTLEVHSVDFSPNEELVASGSRDCTIRIWNRTNGHCTVLKDHKDWVRTVTFSPSGKYVASGSDDRSIRIWNVETRKSTILSTVREERGVSSIPIAYSLDGKNIASSLADNAIKIWDTEGHLISSLEGHTNTVLCLAYSHDGSKIVSGSNDTTIRVWDSKDGKTICKLIPDPQSDERSPTQSVCFSHDNDNKRILSGSADGNIYLWDVKSGSLLFHGKHSIEGSVIYVSFFPDDLHFVSASGSDDRTVKVWYMDCDLKDMVKYEQREDGWVVDKDDQLLLWVPMEYRDKTCSFGNTKIIGCPFYVKVDFTGCIVGDEWIKQFSPPW